jgi:hypothetical protein
LELDHALGNLRLDLAQTFAVRVEDVQSASLDRQLQLLSRGDLGQLVDLERLTSSSTDVFPTSSMKTWVRGTVLIRPPSPSVRPRRCSSRCKLRRAIKLAASIRSDAR